MKRYPVLALAMVLPVCAVTVFSVKAVPTIQAQESKSDFDECAARQTGFKHMHPNPTLTERIEGYYLLAQCQE